MVAGMGWVLTSALYLNAAWDTPFEVTDTAPGAFTPATGKPVTVAFMHGFVLPAATSGGWTGVSLPYQGRRLAMLALLPPASAGPCAVPGTTDLANIAGEVAGTGPDRADVRLPKASIASDARMDAELGKLGMAVAFTGSADFTALSPSAGNIGFVQQAATLKVSEKGTLAAAAAAAGVVPVMGHVPGTEVDFARPYLLLVTDTRTGEPLFLAKVANPARGLSAVAPPY
jgi:serpin B